MGQRIIKAGLNYFLYRNLEIHGQIITERFQYSFIAIG